MLPSSTNLRGAVSLAEFKRCLQVLDCQRASNACFAQTLESLKQPLIRSLGADKATGRKIQSGKCLLSQQIHASHPAHNKHIRQTAFSTSSNLQQI
jgi:hypothetical protein